MESSALPVGRHPRVVAVKSYPFYEKIIGGTDSEFEVGHDYQTIEDAKDIQVFPNDRSDCLRVVFRFESGSVVRTFQEKRI